MLTIRLGFKIFASLKLSEYEWPGSFIFYFNIGTGYTYKFWIFLFSLHHENITAMLSEVNVQIQDEKSRIKTIIFRNFQKIFHGESPKFKSKNLEFCKLLKNIQCTLGSFFPRSHVLVKLEDFKHEERLHWTFPRTPMPIYYRYKFHHKQFNLWKFRSELKPMINNCYYETFRSTLTYQFHLFA